MKAIVMIGVNRRITPGGFTPPRKRKGNYSQKHIIQVAEQFLATRIIRNKDVHP